MRTQILAPLVSLLIASSASSAVAQPPPAAPTPAPTPTSPAAPPTTPPAEPSKTNIDLATLQQLHERHVLSDAEYESAMKDLADTSGAHAGESTSLVVGKWATTLYGFIEADSIYDSTQSFNDLAGNAQVARPGSYAGDNDRVMFGVRNSRIGLRIKAPEYAGVRVSAVAEMDFLGTQLPIGYGQPYFGTEAAFFTNPTFRIRHMYLKAETDVVDVLIGQYWQLFGWQSVYHPNTVEIQGVPGQIYSRTPQIRISKSIKAEPVTIEVALAAMRPPQRDSAVPEGQAGLRLAFDGWTGVQTAGATATSIQPLSVAVTGDLRHVSPPELSATPAHQASKDGAAIAVDGFIPVIPGSKGKMANSLSLNGEFASGYGIADLYTGLTGGATITLPNPLNLNPPPAYPQDIDNGIVAFSPTGQLSFIQWTTYLVGLQYYLPGLGGHVWVSANYSHQESPNMAQFFPNSTKVRAAEDWFDVNLFTDVTPALRLGVEYAHFDDKYIDGQHAINHRGQFSAWFIY